MSATAAPRPRAERGGLRARLDAVLRVVRALIGVPDYDRYCAHMRQHHPGCAVMTRDEFARARMNDKYSRPGSRCC